MNAFFGPHSLGALLGLLKEDDFECWREDDRLNLSFDMPGFDKGKISVVATDDVLTVSATRETRHGEQEYYRQFVLPPGIDSEKSEAKYENGVLSVSFPSTSHKRQIEVK